MMTQVLNNKVRNIGLGLILASGIAVATPAVHAQTAPVNGLSQMSTDITTIGSLKDAAIPIAVAAMAFALGHMIVKHTLRA
ncbi:MAG: hypothetical protein NVS2B14_11950 [Chamaesiphon sp.]